MKISRRAAIQSGILLPLLRWQERTTPSIREKDSSFDPWIEIRSAHLQHNVSEINKLVGGRPILAVIKNNGYGLGTVNVARILEPLQPILGFAVVKLQEALTLRDSGINKPILLLGPFDESDLEEATSRDISVMVYTPIAETLSNVANKLMKSVRIHFCIDTGIGRVGVPHQDAATLLRTINQAKGIRVEGTMMTFTEDAEFDREQLRRFDSVCTDLRGNRVNLGKRHAASSFGLFQHPEAFLDMVRPGMAIFGMYPEKEFRGTGVMDLRPAVALRTKVIYVKKLPKGESAGYNRTYKARENVWVATLPVGHADGYPRSSTTGAKVRIGDSLYPVVAISASHCIVEIGNEPRVKVGDIATMFDWESESRPEDVAESCNSSVYDLTMHLNPLLPRKIL